MDKPKADQGGDGSKVPPEVEEELAALVRPTTTEGLFALGADSAERRRQIEDKIRLIMARYGLAGDAESRPAAGEAPAGTGAKKNP